MPLENGSQAGFINNALFLQLMSDRARLSMPIFVILNAALASTRTLFLNPFSGKKTQKNGRQNHYQRS